MSTTDCFLCKYWGTAGCPLHTCHSQEVDLCSCLLLRPPPWRAICTLLSNFLFWTSSTCCVDLPCSNYPIKGHEDKNCGKHQRKLPPINTSILAPLPYHHGWAEAGTRSTLESPLVPWSLFPGSAPIIIQGPEQKDASAITHAPFQKSNHSANWAVICVARGGSLKGGVIVTYSFCLRCQRIAWVVYPGTIHLSSFLLLCAIFFPKTENKLII